jgi:hypothetical protein
MARSCGGRVASNSRCGGDVAPLGRVAAYGDWEAIEPGNSREGTAGGFGRRGFCGHGNRKSGLVFPHGGHSARMGNLDIRIIPG